MFSSVKVGDVVLVERVIKKSAFDRFGERFFVPAKVENVTKTQFTANGRRLKKDNGREVGSAGYRSYAKQYSKELDQQSDFDACLELVTTRRKVMSAFNGMQDKVNATDIERLKEIEAKMIEWEYL